MPLYTFTVGSADFDAWNHCSTAIEALAYGASISFTDVLGRSSLGYGYWDGDEERITQYYVRLDSDEQADRIAYALAIATGNDAIMVHRVADNYRDESAMRSTRAYRVSKHITHDGNGIRLNRMGVRERFEHNPTGNIVAWYINKHGAVKSTVA